MKIVVHYGSHVRGDSKEKSDIDVLVVGDETRATSGSLDVVHYTKNRLERLRERGSLFLIHLRNESVIVQDDQGWMREFLASIEDYVPEISDIYSAEENVTAILETKVASCAEMVWFDALFVFVRDWVIKRNARSGIYVFAPEQLLDKCDIPCKQKLNQILAESRRVKNVYRSGEATMPRLSIAAVKKVFQDVLGKRIVSRTTTEQIEGSSNKDPYLLLRLVEMGLVEGRVAAVSKDVRKFIMNPHRYSWQIRSKEWLANIRIV